MSFRQTTGDNAVDPVTGIPVILGPVRVTQAGALRVTQTTGEPPSGRNQLPGTDPNFPGVIGPRTRTTQVNDTRITQVDDVRITQNQYYANIGLPYGFEEVPETGPLGPRT